MQLYHGPLPHLSKGSLGPGEGAGRRPDPNLFQAWITASEDMEDQLWVRDAPAPLSSCFGAWLCPQGLCQPRVPSRHPCVSLHLQHRAQAVLASPGVPHVLALSWGCLQQLSAWSCCSTQHSSAHSWGRPPVLLGLRRERWTL